MIELRDALQVLAADRLSPRRRRFARADAQAAMLVAELVGGIGLAAIVAAALLVVAGVL